MEGYTNDADFAGYAFGAPGKVAGIEAESTVFGVATTGADEMDTFSADTGVGWLTTLFEGSEFLSVWCNFGGSQLLPLLAIICSLGSGS